MKWIGRRQPKTRISRPVPLTLALGGVTAGLGLAYWLDPERGPRRRAQVRDKSAHAMRAASHAAEVSARDLAHRSRGLVARARTRANALKHPVDDTVLEQRVRARIGRLCSHPGSIHVAARQGTIELRGPILAAEHDAMLKGIARVPGVRGVDDQLAAHESSDGIPGLQGGDGPARPVRADLWQRNWSPATRGLVGAAGLLLLGRGLMRRGITASGTRLLGLGLLVRSATNLPFKRIAGIGAGRKAIELRKDMYVDAPIEEVFAVFSKFEDFPRFMSHVLEVKRIGDDRFKWSVTGPGGVPVSWEAEVTKLVPNEVIAFKSIPGSIIGNAGVIRFVREGSGTHIGLRLSYNPPGGAIGHAFAKVLGADPKKQLDDDFLRLKSLFEVGKATGHETVTREELTGSLPEGSASRH